MDGSFARSVNAPINPKTGQPWTADEIKQYLAAIPHFARGGIIRKPTVGIVAEAGPEAIIKLPQHIQNAKQRGAIFEKIRAAKHSVRPPQVQFQ